MTEYFDDMWLSLEQELTGFDNYISDKDWMSSSAPNTPSAGEMRNDPFNEPLDRAPLTPQTYEELLLLDQPPDSQNLHSKSRSERIEAVRQLYNQIPTIINASSFAESHRVANRLYRIGKVKEANFIVAEVDKTISKSFTYIEDSPTHSKALEASENDGDKQITIEITDKETKSRIVRTFDNTLEAVKFFLKPSYEKEDNG